MRIPATDLIVIMALLAAGFVACYLLLLRKLRSVITDRQLKLADQLGTLDDAIRALETRLSEHQARLAAGELSRVLATAQNAPVEPAETEAAEPGEEAGEITPEIQAAIAAAAVATLGQNAVVQSVKAAPSPWTQQGRVMVQGGHNLRVRQ